MDLPGAGGYQFAGEDRQPRGCPVLSGSKATRALQAADLVAYTLYRYYAGGFEDRFTHRLWTLFDTDQGKIHGLHQCPRLRVVSLPCLPKQAVDRTTGAVLKGGWCQMGP